MTNTQTNYQDLLNGASALAVAALSDLVSYDGEDCANIVVGIVERIIEAATAATFFRLETEGARRRRAGAVDVLREHLCDACIVAVDPEAVLEIDDDVAGATELAERSLFLGWAGEVERLAVLVKHEAGEPETPRGRLVFELHASVADRHPIGIAETLYDVIGSLHVGDDRAARLSLEDLAEAELTAARFAKAEWALGAMRVLVDPEIDEEHARNVARGWTLEELVLVESWAGQAFKAATAEAATPTKPAVVAALERELDQ